ncbi:MAG: glycosyltransferase family 4 protein [Acidimicrobiales bacterium]
MRLTIVNQFYAPDISPTAQLAASLAEHRAEQGDEVTIVTGRAGYLERYAPPAPVRTGPRLHLRRIWTPHLGKSSLWRRLLGYLTFTIGGTARLVTLPRQDVIVAMTTPPLIVVAAILHRLIHRRARVVLWSMDCYPDAAERFGELRPGSLLSRTLRTVNRWALRRIDHVVALDGAMVDLLRTYATHPEPAFSVIPNWERAEQFPLPGAEVEPWPGYDGLPTEGRTVVVYLGNTGVGHRFDTVLDAAEQLGDEALFLFVGGGARWTELQDEVRRRQLGNVALRGYVPKEDTPGVMAGADGALITLDDRSLGVMSPSKLHANLAAGLPVVYVGPTGSNVDEAIAAHGCGRSLRHGDVEGIVAAVRGLRGDEAMARRARTAFETAYSDDAALPAFDAVLDASPLR